MNKGLNKKCDRVFINTSIKQRCGMMVFRFSVILAQTDKQKKALKISKEEEGLVRFFPLKPPFLSSLALIRLIYHHILNVTTS